MQLSKAKEKHYIDHNGMRCPFCRTDTISTASHAENSSACPEIILADTECTKCKRKFHEIYTLTAVELQEEEEDESKLKRS